jgi:sugar/nucleoside kinase (ribokinase family)
MFDLTVVGHFTMDYIIGKEIKKPRWTLGGPPTYVSLAAASLNAKVSVVSKVGGDFPEEYVTWLSRLNIDVCGLKLARYPTTRFIIEYKNGERTLQLKSRCASINPEDLPERIQSKGVHIAPVAREIPVETVLKLSGRTKFISLDPQGYVREFDKEGFAHLKKWLNKRILRGIHLFKSSIDELKVISGIDDVKIALMKIKKLGPEISIATMGVNGVVVLTPDNSFYRIPACKPRRIEDPTGAGDAFIGAFLAEYLRGEDLIWAAAVGSASASFVVEGAGPSSFGARDEVIERAQEARDKIRRI